MKKKNKTIVFKAGSDYADKVLSIPKPSASSIPEWYKEQKLFSDGENDWIKSAFKSNSSGGAVGTYKLCVPVVDSLTAGYTINTTADIFVLNNSSQGYFPSFSWKVQYPILDMPEGAQTRGLGNYPIPHGYSNAFTRWNVDWHINTPAGYSLWITHPSHRYDLPFLTINGFVDSDKHTQQLKLPFFIKYGFEGLIESGTPIAQIIPVKRDNWDSKKEKYDESYSYNGYNILSEKFVRSYKNKFWSKKVYR